MVISLLPDEGPNIKVKTLCFWNKDPLVNSDHFSTWQLPAWLRLEFSLLTDCLRRTWKSTNANVKLTAEHKNSKIKSAISQNIPKTTGNLKKKNTDNASTRWSNGCMCFSNCRLFCEKCFVKLLYSRCELTSFRWCSILLKIFLELCEMFLKPSPTLANNTRQNSVDYQLFAELQIFILKVSSDIDNYSPDTFTW